MTEPQILDLLLDQFRAKLDEARNHLVPRDAKFPDIPTKIKVAIGMRRSGKTYFLYQRILELLAEGVNLKQILFINFEDDRLRPANERTIATLVDAFYSTHPENHDKKCYFFFDEIQTVENWPIVIRRLHDTKNAELFLAGSSAKLLSKEIATNLRGRSLAVEIWPYSFNEFLRAKNISIDRELFGQKTRDQLAKEFQLYISEGGFPELVKFPFKLKQQTLLEYLDVATYRDLIERHEIKNPSVIKYTILSLLHNVGKPFTINKLYHDLQSQGFQTGRDVLYDYADYIEDTYLAFAAGLHDRSIRKTQTNPKKIYAIDPALVRAITFDYESDLGRLFENIVYLDLRRLKYNVHYYLTEQRHEIDFLAQTARGEKKFFQVAWDVQDPKTLEREQRALQEGMKELNIEGELITLQSYLQYGIRPFER